MNREEFEKAIVNVGNSFTASKEKIGARSVIFQLLPKKLTGISKKFSEGKPLSNVQILELRSAWLSEDPLIDENGNPFVFYIHDFAETPWGKPNRVFHVAWCSVLKMMDKAGRKERYVKKEDLNNNNFLVDFGGNRKKEFRQLPCCYRCRNKMINVVAPRNLYYDRDNLDIVKFFQMYGKQDLINMNNPMYSVDYPKNWAQISKKTKKERGGKCETCGSTSNLEVHHKNGNKGDISSENLIVLCRECHIKQFGHSHMRQL